MKRLHFSLQNALLLTAAFFAGGTTVLAQGRTPLPRSADSIKESTVSVYQTYQPELRPVIKPVLLPTTPPADTQAVPQQYAAETLPPAVVPYYPVPLKPVALERDVTRGPGLDYVKIGGGNLGSFLFEGATARLSAPGIQSLFFVKHLGHANGSIASQSQQTTDAAWTFSGSAGNLGQWKAFVEGQRRSYGQYGFNEGRALPFEGKNVYFGIAAGGSLRTDSGSFLGGAAPAFQFRLFRGPQIGTEKTVLITLPARYAVAEGLALEATFHTALTSVSQSNTSYNNSYAQLGLAMNYERERLALRVGVTPTLDRQNDIYILPDLSIRYSLSPQRFWVEGGWKGSLLQNRLETLSGENPYLNSYFPTQTRAYELWAGLGANVGPYVTATIRVSDTRFKDLLLFVNDLQTVSETGFSLLSVPKAGAFSVSGSLRYLIGKTVALEAWGALYGYRSEDVSRLWHLPNQRLRLGFYWQALKNLELQSNLSVASGLYARGAFGQVVDLDAVSNLSAGADYSFYKNWSLGLKVDNILNRRNERYWGYPAFGFNVLGSLQVRF